MMVMASFINKQIPKCQPTMGKTNNKGLEGEETGQKLQIIQLC